jgi:hypothetical protein
MDGWIQWKFYSELPKEVIWKDALWDDITKIKTEELTEEQREQIKTRFKYLQESLTKPFIN